MRYLAPLLAVALLAACGRVEPAAELALTATRPPLTAAIITPSPVAATHAAAIAEASASPTVTAAQGALPMPSTAAQTYTPEPAPLAAFGRLRYLLPTDLAGYRVTSDADETYADERGFYVEITPQSEEPGPFTTITIAGGEPAAPVWAANQPSDEPGALIEPISVRGATGTLTSSGLGAAVAWVEDGHPYYVYHPGPDAVTILSFAEMLFAGELHWWREALGLAPPAPLSVRLRGLTVLSFSALPPYHSYNFLLFFNY